MHCSHKTFHFLSVSDSPTSILSDIVMTLRKSHEIIFVWRIFEKPKILARDVFETSQRRHGKDIFFEICPRRLKDVTQKTSFWRCFWVVSKTSQKRHLFWGVSERSLRYLSQWKSDWDLSETSHACWVATRLLTTDEINGSKLMWFNYFYTKWVIISETMY